MGNKVGVGVTHVTLMIGQYFSKHRGRVALVEWGNRRSFENLYKTVYGVDDIESKDYFSVRKTHYYYQYQNEGLGELKKENYQVIVVDFGSYSPKKLHLFNEVDIQLFVGRGDDWNYLELIETLRNIPENEINGWKIVLPNGTGVIKRLIHKNTRLNTYSLPYCNPFDLNNECRLVINKVLGV